MATDGLPPLHGAITILAFLADETRLRLLFLLWGERGERGRVVRAAAPAAAHR